MNPYRSASSRSDLAPLGPRWNVSRQSRWYVRIVRIFFNLRDKYKERREYNQYLRDLAWWKQTYGKVLGRDIIDGRVKLPIPPMPLPPPIRIME